MTDRYSADQIQVLTGLEAVRTRPGMYIGSTGPRGLHHLVYEVADNSINEALADRCTRIEVDLNADGSVTVTDNGRGIPTKINPKTGKSFLEEVLTVLCAGYRAGDGYKVAGGIHGVGVVVVNALSEWLQVTVWRGEQIYSQRFEKGVAVTQLTAKPNPENLTGTSICFKPDAEIFKNGIEFDRPTLVLYFRQLAYLNPGLTITLTDNRLEILGSCLSIETYCFPNGIREYVAHLNSDVEPLHEDIIYIQGDRDGVQVEIACQWHLPKQDNFHDRLLGFANCVRNFDGGIHCDTFTLTVRQVVNAIGRQLGKLKNTDPVLGWKDLLECGFTGVIAVKLPNPEFEGAIKSRLANPEVREIVKSLVEKELMAYLTARPEVAGAIVRQAIEIRDAIAIARQARAVRRQQQRYKTIIDRRRQRGDRASEPKD